MTQAIRSMLVNNGHNEWISLSAKSYAPLNCKDLVVRHNSRGHGASRAHAPAWARGGRQYHYFHSHAGAWERVGYPLICSSNILWTNNPINHFHSRRPDRHQSHDFLARVIEHVQISIATQVQSPKGIEFSIYVV